MVRLFVLIKKSGSNRPLGAIPAKKGISMAKLKSSLSGRVRKGFSITIISESQLKMLLMKLPAEKRLRNKRKATKKKTLKRRVGRRKKAVRRKVKRRRR